MDYTNLHKRIDQEFESIKKNILKPNIRYCKGTLPNILLAGATGVGKSSLVNLCFGQDFAETGTGKPVTQNMFAYSRG